MSHIITTKCMCEYIFQKRYSGFSHVFAPPNTLTHLSGQAIFVFYGPNYCSQDSITIEATSVKSLAFVADNNCITATQLSTQASNHYQTRYIDLEFAIMSHLCLCSIIMFLFIWSSRVVCFASLCFTYAYSRDNAL